MEKPKKIKIVENGPYLVTGNIPLTEKELVRENGKYRLREIRQLEHAEDYALCRCGRSKNAPFCDGSHLPKTFRPAFKGAETASMKKYEERAEFFEGPGVDLLDDHRCALLRFCHREKGDVWSLVERSGDEENKAEAIRGAGECPAGRITAITKEGTLIEPELEPGIEIIQDPENNVSAGIYVKGKIPIESAEGVLYEARSRVVLCRCGNSRLKPFCDKSHVEYLFKDKQAK